jgi:hypothetical protein
LLQCLVSLITVQCISDTREDIKERGIIKNRAVTNPLVILAPVLCIRLFRKLKIDIALSSLCFKFLKAIRAVAV